jgi:hypothetical protein
VDDYNIEGLEAVRAKLAALEAKRDRDAMGNHNKYRPVIHAALLDVERIELKLKERGELPWTAEEILAHHLDRAYPDAMNKQVIEHQGKRYERCWIPVEHDIAGGVSRWKGLWMKLDGV